MLVLASQSPRRQQLLALANISFSVLKVDADESYPMQLPIEEVAAYIAKTKADAAFELEGADKIIIAADTIVVHAGKVLGKPTDYADAKKMLQQLSASQHQVFTGVVIKHGEKEIIFTDVTTVVFHPLTDEQIAFYISNFSPYDKAGAYGVQDWIGAVGIKSISGDFYNVMGLPISRVVQALSEFGINSVH